MTAGAVLAGLVWKSFERIDAVLTELTKYEVAVWLVGIDPTRPAKALQELMSKGSDGIFGKRQASWHCAIAVGVPTITLAAIVSPSLAKEFCVVTDCASLIKSGIALSLVLFPALFWCTHCMRGHERIPAKVNANSEGKANGIPGRRRKIFGA